MDSLELQELKSEITCAICKDYYIQPKILPCLHYYCKDCILKLALMTGIDKPFSCPECGKEATLPGGRVDQLQTALYINRLKVAFSILERTCGKVVVKCDACKDSGVNAEAFCRECAVFICRKCLEAHQKLKYFSSHVVVSFHEFEGKKSKDIVVKELSTEMCSAHREMLIIHCYDCGCLICRHCTVKDHQDHHFEFSAVAAPRIKDKGKEELDPQREVKIGLSNVVDEKQITQNELEADEDFMTNTSKTSFSFQELPEITDNSKQELLEEDKMKVSKKAASLSLQENNLSSTSAEFQTVIDYKEITEVRHINGIGLVIKLNKATKSSVKIDCQFKSVYNGSIINCAVDRVGADEYHIQFAPTVRGRHELTVVVDGQQIAGSPFPVFISIHPTQLGKPVRVWENISMPAGITVNSAGEIIVVGWDGDVMIFDKEGKILRFIKCSNLEFCRLAGVSVDSKDHVYLVADCKDTVFKLNKNGVVILKKDVNQVNGPGHFGVAVFGDEVMICECHNQGRFMVYDRELKYVKQIIGEDMGEFFGLSTDCDGNLYIADSVNSCIRIFSRDGDFLRSFGCDGNSVEKSSRPYYVHVAGQYVYVTDYGNDNVSVFTVEGEFVTSFGQYGSKEGDFNYPHGVWVDKDGFVYVCDLFNNRLQVF